MVMKFIGCSCACVAFVIGCADMMIHSADMTWYNETRCWHFMIHVLLYNYWLRKVKFAPDTLPCGSQRYATDDGSCSQSGKNRCRWYGLLFGKLRGEIILLRRLRPVGGRTRWSGVLYLASLYGTLPITRLICLPPCFVRNKDLNACYVASGYIYIIHSDIGYGHQRAESPVGKWIVLHQHGDSLAGRACGSYILNIAQRETIISQEKRHDGDACYCVMTLHSGTYQNTSGLGI
jgi:hypothetical protein